MEVQLRAFLTLAVDGGEWSVSLPDSLTAGERAPSSHWVGGSLSPRTGLDAVTKRRNPIIVPAGI